MAEYYKRPPIVKRSLTVGIEIGDEPFQLRLDAWQDLVRSTFPLHDVATQWQLAIKEKDGFPTLEQVPGAMQVIHRYLDAKPPQTTKIIELSRHRILFTFLSRPGHSGRFSDLQGMVNDWYAKFAQHFGVATYSGMTLEYLNIISEAMTPAFVKKGSILLGEVVTYLIPPQAIPNLVPPYRYEMNAAINDKAPLRLFHVSLNGVQGENMKGAPELSLLFRVTSGNTAASSGHSELEKDATMAHEYISERFKVFFTDNALKSFEPE